MSTKLPISNAQNTTTPRVTAAIVPVLQSELDCPLNAAELLVTPGVIVVDAEEVPLVSAVLSNGRSESCQMTWRYLPDTVNVCLGPCEAVTVTVGTMVE